MSKLYICSAEPGCNETFTKFVDFKRHEAAHSVKGYICTWPGCNFATMTRSSYDIHSAKHTGEKRYICPHDGCNYKTHDPALFTRHRQKQHGYVPQARGRGAPSAKGSSGTKSSSQPPAQPQPPVQPPLPGTYHQYKLQPVQPQSMQQQQPILPRFMQPQPVQSQPMQPQPVQSQPIQPQPIPPRHMQFYPTPYKSQPTQYQPPPPVYNPSLGVFYDSADTADDYTMYTRPARTPNGWTEGCICPELMQRRPSEILGYEYEDY
ncbi:uncharacterized protein BJ212DRAFT_1578992 [Suillus subaureus]|uniref:C2H2-type domain-containing protein n=1 Tax=Suillus subaureus TaxID=48587 RepID=A0A9P7E5F4_9AGAM|nr:uncharacterized protein BJ212DRAFT_1578992 [Suillus subaureus]KAG1811791.1 hypothetical protein BJ212DRAFT_1578992 [Suillus subaureus]